MEPPCVQASPTDHSRGLAEVLQPHESARLADLRGRFPDLSDVDELAQDADVRLFASRRTDWVARPKADVLITARNAALALYRRDKVVPVIGISEVADPVIPKEGPDAAEFWLASPHAGGAYPPNRFTGETAERLSRAGPSVLSNPLLEPTLP
jgi:DNA-directed RNA polymerase specialized sigma24 family protein